MQKSAKLEIEILITIGIDFEAEVLNEFGVFLLFESENQTARSPNEKDRTAKGFKFEDEALSILALAVLKPRKDFEDVCWYISPFENDRRIMEISRRRPVLFIASRCVDTVESLLMRHGGIQKQTQLFNLRF